MTRWLLIAALMGLAACSRQPETTAAGSAASQTPAAAPAKAGIAWVRSQSSADVEDAFARAKADNLPVFLFWTAAWCPPCNQVKSTIFTRSDFIDKSRAFVPIYVDGDTPSGQALGKRFSVGAYPTMVLLRPDGSELTRLAGSVEPAKYMQLLERGLGGGPSAKELLASALAGKPLGPDDWRQLAYYSWGTDEQQLVPAKDAPATLLKLAAACPAEQRESSSRLVLQAISMAGRSKENERPKINKSDVTASLRSLLARPELVREHYDLVAFSGDELIPYLTAPKSKDRIELTAAWDAALDQLSTDRTLSNAGRVWVTLGKVGLARMDNKNGPLPEALLADVRATAVRADRDTTDLDERQSVITAAGSLLSEAGLLDESDALLTAELERSHSPYYYMLELADNAKKRGTPAGNAAALDWARQAWETSKGPATRLQWGGVYVRYLIDLAPKDTTQIENVAAAIIRELPPQTGALSARSQKSLERMSGRLVGWNKNGGHDAVLARLHTQIVPVCAQAASDVAERTSCEALFTKSSSTSGT